MTSQARATALLTGGYAVQVLSGAALWKVQAVILGTQGVGRLALLQSLLSLGGIAIGVGLGPALTRAIAARADDPSAITALRRSAAAVRMSAWAAMTAGVVVLHAWLGRQLLDGELSTADAALLVCALGAASLLAHDMAVVSGLGRVRALALLSCADAVAGATAAGAVVLVFGANGITGSLAASSLAACAVARCTVLRVCRRSHPPRFSDLAEARPLLRGGFILAASLAAGTGAGLAVPLVVVRAVGTDGVALYQAAAVICVTYLGFLVAAMAQDYYPRLSAASPEELQGVVDTQVRLAVLASIPLILLTFALAPEVLRIVYAPSFAAGAAVMRWMVLADGLRFLSWCASFAIMARCRSSVFFGLEALYGVLVVGASALFSGVMGVSGLGLAVLAGYAGYLVATAAVARRSLGIHLIAGSPALCAAALVSLAAPGALQAVGATTAAAAIAGTLGIVWAVIAGPRLLASVRTRRAVEAGALPPLARAAA